MRIPQLTILLLGLSLILLCCGNPVGAQWTGSNKGSVEEHDQHTITIARHFAGELEEELITIAENAFPPNKSLLNCRGTSKVPNSWSCGDADDTLLPYAITSDAIDYFINHSRTARNNSTRSHYLYQTRLNYESRIKRETNTRRRNVFIVTMHLSWGQSCKPTPNMCSMIFEKTRTVVIDAHGSVLNIQGDGPTMAMFS